MALLAPFRNIHYSEAVFSKLILVTLQPLIFPPKMCCVLDFLRLILIHLFILQWQVSTGTDRPLSACGFAPNDVADSYFVMQYINTAPAEEVTMNIQYKLSCCLPDKVFRFSIGLYVYRSPLKLPSSYPDPNTFPYSYIGEFRNTSVMQGGSKIPFTSQKVVGMKGTNGLYIAFRDRGICGTVDSIDMHYYECPRRGGQLMTFHNANAPNSSMAVLRINGKCTPNSEPENMTGGENFMLCYPNGTAAVYGGCHCLPGYRNLSLSACTGKRFVFFYSHLSICLHISIYFHDLRYDSRTRHSLFKIF